MNFRDMELDFDIFDADTADDYTTALERAKARFVDKKDGEIVGDAIRRQCHAVFDFFDELFEPGFHKEIFGERTNLILCMEAFRDFVDDVDTQKEKINTILAEAQAKNAERVARTGNRATRRAVAKKV